MESAKEQPVNVTYILQCEDGSLYTGWTNVIVKRYEAHAGGYGCKYTRSHPPVGIVYLEFHETKEEAMSREYAIKRLKRAQKEAMIAASDWMSAVPRELADTLPLL